jgi:uncharacterized protein (TIGR02118 family)
MLAAISFIRRRDDVSLTTFRRHWLDVHGPLVCRFAGLQRYVQCHVIATAAMNDVAHNMRIDGFPILYFANDIDRQKSQGSPEMAACNVDSRLFIGAVSRVMADVEPAVQLASPRSPLSLIMLSPEGEADQRTEAALFGFPWLRGGMRFRVAGQGPAPSSTVPHLPVTVSGVAQFWFDSVVDLEAAVATVSATTAGLFVVEDHALEPSHP